MSRVARLGRLYKLVKLTRLLRILKLLNSRNNFFKQLTEQLSIGVGIERMFYFCLCCLLGLHSSACFWLITAQLNATDNINDFLHEQNNLNYDGTWLGAFH